MAISGDAENSRNQTNSYSGTQNKNGIRRPEKVTRINEDFDYLSGNDLPPNPSSDQIYIKNQEKRLLQSQSNLADNKENRRKKSRPVDNFNEETATGGTDRMSISKKIAGTTLKKSGLNTSKRLLARTRVSAINSSIAAWTTFIYFAQLVLALLSIIGLGLASAVTDAVDSNWIVSTVTTVLGKIADLLGLDFGVIGGLFLIPWALVMVIGLITLFTACIMYYFALINPLSGEGAGFKMGAFLLAIIGYAVPIANLFPWIYVFMFAVWKYPR